MRESHGLGEQMVGFMSRVSELLGGLGAAVSANAAAVAAYTDGHLRPEDIQSQDHIADASKACAELDVLLVAEIIRLQQMPSSRDEEPVAEPYLQSLLAFRRAAAAGSALCASWQGQTDAPDFAEWLAIPAKYDLERQKLVDQLSTQVAAGAAQYELAADALARLRATIRGQ